MGLPRADVLSKKSSTPECHAVGSPSERLGTTEEINLGG